MTDNTYLQACEEGMQASIEQLEEAIQDAGLIREAQVRSLQEQIAAFALELDMLKRRCNHHFNTIDAHEEGMKKGE